MVSTLLCLPWSSELVVSVTILGVTKDTRGVMPCRYVPKESPEERDVDERSEDWEVKEGGDVHTAAEKHENLQANDQTIFGTNAYDHKNMINLLNTFHHASEKH